MQCVCSGVNLVIWIRAFAFGLSSRCTSSMTTAYVPHERKPLSNGPTLTLSPGFAKTYFPIAANYSISIWKATLPIFVRIAV